MSDLLNAVKSYYPGNGDIGVPLLTDIIITLTGLDYDHTSIKDGLFVEGPDTDQFVGPGLLSLSFPNNVSQGDIDDFLQSPGYKGIVKGTTTVSGIDGDTVITFDPTLPLAALTEYTVNLTSVFNTIEEEIEGYLTFSFTSGTGSIEELPASLSTSILGSAISEASAAAGAGPSVPLAVVKTTPKDRSIQNPTNLSEVLVEFNNPLSEESLNGQVIVKTSPVSDHPSVSSNSQGTLATSLEVQGKTLKIKI